MRISLVCLVLTCMAAPARAQTAASAPQMPRGDASVSMAWLISEVSALSHGIDNWVSRATIAGQGGIYWTEHVKTEVMVERSNRQEVYEGEQVFLPEGRSAWRNNQHTIHDTRLSVGQFYQFGHNAWAHASIGGGVSVAWRDIATEVSPLVIYDGRGTVIVQPGEHLTSNDVRTNAFVATGVKAYVTPHLFVRTDAQADFRRDLDNVVFRVGFGVDF